MALTNGIVVQIMCWSDLYAASTKFFIDITISNDRNLAVGQWQFEHFANQMDITLICRVDGDGYVTQQCFWTSCCDGQMARAIRKWVADVPHKAVFFFRHDFQIRYGSAQDRIPVDEAFATVDQTLLYQAHKYLGDNLGALGVHGEIFTIPICRCTQATHLTRNGRARFFFPFPDFF